MEVKCFSCFSQKNSDISFEKYDLTTLYILATMKTFIIFIFQKIFPVDERKSHLDHFLVQNCSSDNEKPGN